MGIATETDIRDCVGKIYGPSANVESSSTATTIEDSNNGNNIDTNDSLSKDLNNTDIWPIPQ